jgi:CRP-like cAMP-binding protein
MSSVYITLNPKGLPTPEELRRTYLLSALEQADFERVTGTLHVHRLEKDERLFGHGEPATRFFLVRHGQIKLYRLSAEGQEKTISIEGPGSTFAEAVMFMEQRVYPVSAEAVETSEVLSFDNRTFLAVLRHSFDTCFRLMAAMSMRLHAQINEIDNLCLHNATFRLVTFLLREVPEGTDDASRVELSLPKGVLASRLSIQRETFSRILARLREKNLIEVEGQTIRLRDLPALRAMVCM